MKHPRLIYHIYQWDKFFEEIARVMKPGAAFEVGSFYHQKRNQTIEFQSI
jgi:hypothetical protein